MPTPEPDQTRPDDPVDAAILRWFELVKNGGPIDLGELTDALTEEERADFEADRGRLESIRAHLVEVVGLSPTETGPEPSGVEGRYVDLRPHDSGGMGDVYLARDVELGRDVAYKVMKPLSGDRERVRERFAREAEVTARLQYPGIVPVYGLVEDRSGRPAYAMEFVKGPTLRE
jgi:hypothetical protein